MKLLLYLLPLMLLSDACKNATQNKSRIHPITHKEIEKEIENNLLIIKSCRKYPDVIKEAKLYNEYLMFNYLKLPTIQINDMELIERCKMISRR